MAYCFRNLARARGCMDANTPFYHASAGKKSKALVRLIGAMKAAQGGRTVTIASHEEDGKGRRNRGAASPSFGKTRQIATM